MVAEYTVGAEYDPFEDSWFDLDGNLRDLRKSEGWTYEIFLQPVGGTTVINKTADIVGNNVEPNFVVTWNVNELDNIVPGPHILQMIAIKGGKNIAKSVPINFKRKLAPVP